MKYIKFEFGTDYTGTDDCDYMVFDNDITDGEVDEIAAEIANDNAEQYTYLATGWDDDLEGDELEEVLDGYYEGVWWNWEEVSEEEFNENC